MFSKKKSPQMNYAVRINGKVIPDTRMGDTTALVGESGLDLAENVFIGHFNFIEASNGIRIEEGCQITNYISILSHSSHISIRLYGKSYRKEKDPIGYVKGSVEIGKYTFVGPHSTIMPGTKIGKGSIVSAYSLVKGEFPDFAIIAGNPAEVVGDTRDMDKKYLDEHPDLKRHYLQWAEDEK
jgi:acetyltransferase-like isoleucine patch superfamily enzyme